MKAKCTTCQNCGTKIPSGEKCACRIALEREALELVMQLTPEERRKIMEPYTKKYFGQ